MPHQTKARASLGLKREGCRLASEPTFQDTFPEQSLTLSLNKAVSVLPAWLSLFAFCLFVCLSLSEYFPWGQII